MSDVDPNSLASIMDWISASCPECLSLATAATELDYDAAIDKRLERAMAALEQNKTKYCDVDEEGLSGFLVSSMNGYGLSVTRETHSNGHVDITIEVLNRFPLRRYLGEAKIYRGPAYHFSGLKQLLDRYTTGREGRGLIIVYFFDANIEGKIKALRTQMDAEQPSSQKGSTENHPLPWSFLSVHCHSSGMDCRVGHFACNMHVAK